MATESVSGTPTLFLRNATGLVRGWSVPPCAFTTFEFTMPRAGLGMMKGSAGFGSFDFRTTVELSGALTVTPSSRKDGLPLMLISRLKENATSADVSGVPSLNLMSLRSLNVYVVASDEAVYELATAGTGVVTSGPLKVSSVSYRPLATTPPETSNSRCGSAVFRSNDLSTTSVRFVVVLAPPDWPDAHAPTTSSKPVSSPVRVLDPSR